MAEVTIVEEKLDKYKDLFNNTFGATGPSALGPHFQFSIPSIDKLEEVV